MELRSIVAGAACAWLLAGCGGGGSTGGNSPDESGGTPSTFLEVSAASLPDDALRACVNRLAEENEWQTMADVDVIVCGDVEIRSIDGLQQFPGLRTLRIAAPRLPVEEIPLLAELPLADYERKPFYRWQDESSAANAEPGLKQLLMNGQVRVASDQTITYVVLLSDDPRNPERLRWHNLNGGETSPSLSGAVRVGEFVTLHWIQLTEGETGQFSVLPEYSDENGMVASTHFEQPARVWKDQPIASVNIGVGPFRSCILDNAALRGWSNTWQVTELNCENLNIEAVNGLEYFPRLGSLNLRGNPALEWTRYHAKNTDAEVLTDSIELQSPRVEIRSCGLYIANFDPVAQYRVWQVPRLPGVTYEALDVLHYVLADGLEAEPWQPGETERCMSIAGRGAGAWVVEAAKDGTPKGAELFPVTDENGHWVQYLADDRRMEPLIFLPSETNQHLYVLKASLDDYEIQQLDFQTWHQESSYQVDRLPYLATSHGIYLFPARSKDAWWRRDGAVLLSSGVAMELPARPVAGRPSTVLEYEGEIWLTGIRDEWGARPEILVWNPVSQQWRIASSIGTSLYSAYIAQGNLCATPRYQDESQHCWNSSTQAWETLSEVPFSSLTVKLNDRLFFLEDNLGLYQLSRMVFNFGYPVDVADGTNYWAFIGGLILNEVFPGQGLPELYLRELGAKDDHSLFVGFLPFGWPMRLSLTQHGDELTAVFNDSVARFQFPATPAGGE